MKPKLLIFILGVIVGLLVAYFVPPVIEGWLPEGMGGAKGATQGVVVAKRLEQDRLLLTVESGDGAVLATFKQRVPEIDLLVDTGDHITLGITSYEPFVEDPKILGVKKAKGAMPGETGDETVKAPEMGADGAGEAEAGAETETGNSSEAGEGSGAVTLPPMGPPLEDEPQKPPAGDDGGGSNRS